MEIATLIINRNDPTRTNDLVSRMKSLMSRRERDVFVLESGSDIDNISDFTSIWMKENVNWPQGFNILRHYADKHKWRHSKRSYDAYWMVCNDTQLVDDIDPWAAMEDALEPLGSAGWGAAHPFQHYFKPGHPGYPLNKHGNGIRKVSFIEFVSPLYNRRFLEKVEEKYPLGHGVLDEDFTRGWGIDYETSYLSYLCDMSLYNIDTVGVLHIPNTSHVNHAATKTEDVGTFLTVARVEMLNHLIKKWGPNWGEKFLKVIPDLSDRCFRNWSQGDRAATLKMV